ncbi:hypothetical protein F2P56_015617 [Juglans regia]|uniref:RING-type E3 ubiquitin transferase n=1 Tax=Juglans regia TaxID=51240 RepID=A0A833XG31_JUGRE|nr:hypothetical protein F2P56_015617 [Juglans regia]
MYFELCWEHRNILAVYLIWSGLCFLIDSITIFYFAKEESNCKFVPVFPEAFMPVRIPFQKGPGQKFCQPSGTDEHRGEPVPTTNPHMQITQAILEKNGDGPFQVRVIRQILWIDGVRYELREIYGIGTSVAEGFDDNDPGKECVICMTEPKDTAVLPCRHMVRVHLYFFHFKR